MNNYGLALLAWIGFSPIAGIAVGNFLRRADEKTRACGDRAVNVYRPDRLSQASALQVVRVKQASSR